jgi:hypothetical protein
VCISKIASAESAIHSHGVCHPRRLSRAFSARHVLKLQVPWAVPQAWDEVAPSAQQILTEPAVNGICSMLALNRYTAESSQVRQGTES